MSLAIVTGGASGIGAAIVESLVTDGLRCYRLTLELQRPRSRVWSIESLT